MKVLTSFAFSRYFALFLTATFMIAPAVGIGAEKKVKAEGAKKTTPRAKPDPASKTAKIKTTPPKANPTASEKKPSKVDPTKDEGTGWIKLFNGKDLTGWKISDKGDWKVDQGRIVASGKVSHLFTEREFKNFEFKAEVMTTPGSNSGIYFHTKFQETGFPKYGYESQVNVSHRDPVKTGSLYNTVKLYKTPAKDNTWWTHEIIVKGNRVIVRIDGEQVIDYTEPENKTGPVKLGKGSFAFQAHDPKSVTYYRNIRVRPLAD